MSVPFTLEQFWNEMLANKDALYQAALKGAGYQSVADALLHPVVDAPVAAEPVMNEEEEAAQVDALTEAMKEEKGWKDFLKIVAKCAVAAGKAYVSGGATLPGDVGDVAKDAIEATE